MTADRWSLVEGLFAELNELGPEERAIRLAAIEDESVRKEVAELLEHTGTGNTFSAAIGAVAQRAGETRQKQQHFGPYRVVRRLGQGGQGTVFEAVRDDGSFQQRVAIKAIKWELDNDLARVQFRQERQVLAGLSHPNIARLLDGGQQDDGAPYLVMEFIEGQRLDDATKGWPIGKKLEIFLQILAAVEFAHRNLIVHRDLKPANILVTRDGSPKLLDFGIAKLIDTDIQRTQTMFRALTPEYASPEQVLGKPISTSSDVYSLGVVLYEILTGRKPYVFDTITAAEIDRLVCRDMPSGPGLGDELDHIVMMAMRKEPERRYHSAEQFAEDIRRYLEKRPVRARPDTLWYRTQKYASRHRIGLLAAFVALAGVCGGAAAAIYQARIARLEARVAQQRFNDVRQLANTFLFDFDGEIATLPGSVKARQMVVNTALKYLANLSRGAAGDAALQRELAQAYDKIGDIQGKPGGVSLGQLTEALSSYRKGLETYRRVSAGNPAWLAEQCFVQMHLAWTLRAAGELEQAVREQREATDILEGLLRAKPGDAYLSRGLGKAYGDLSGLASEGLNLVAALQLANRSLELTKAGLSQLDAAHGAYVLANRYMRQVELRATNGDFEGALRFAVEFELQRQRWAEGLPHDINIPSYSLEVQSRLSQMYDSPFWPSMGDTGKAMEHAREIDKFLEVLSQDPNNEEARLERAFQLRRYSYLRGKTSAEAGLRDGLAAITALDHEVASGGGANDLVAEELASVRLLVAGHLARLHRGSESKAMIDRGLESLRVLMAKNKGAIYYQRSLTRNLTAAAASYRRLGDSTAALASSGEAAGMASALHLQRPHEAALLQVVGDAYVERGRCLAQSEAQVWFEKDAALWRDWADPNPYVQIRQKQARVNLEGK